MVVYTMLLWNLATVRPLQINAAKALLPVVFFYNTNVAFALAAVRALSIPVYHVLKRLTPVMVLIGKFLMGGDPPSKQVTLSVVTVVSGIYLFTRIFFAYSYLCMSPNHATCYLQLGLITKIIHRFAISSHGLLRKLDLHLLDLHDT